MEMCAVVVMVVAVLSKMLIIFLLNVERILYIYIFFCQGGKRKAVLMSV